MIRRIGPGYVRCVRSEHDVVMWRKGTYSKVESNLGVLSLNVCEEACLLVRGEFVCECGCGDEG